MTMEVYIFGLRAVHIRDYLRLVQRIIARLPR